MARLARKRTPNRGIGARTPIEPIPPIPGLEEESFTEGLTTGDLIVTKSSIHRVISVTEDDITLQKYSPDMVWTLPHGEMSGRIAGWSGCRIQTHGQSLKEFTDHVVHPDRRRGTGADAQSDSG